MLSEDPLFFEHRSNDELFICSACLLPRASAAVFRISYGKDPLFLCFGLHSYLFFLNKKLIPFFFLLLVTSIENRESYSPNLQKGTPIFRFCTRYRRRKSLPRNTHIYTMESLIVYLLAVLPVYIVVQFFWQIIYYRFFHPLARFPGPFWGSATRLWITWHNIKGDEPWTFRALHEKYGG